MTSTIALFREAAASARGQAVASVLTIAMVGGMCAAVLLTTGRTVAAEEAVLAQIDAAGTRSVIVRADQEAGMTTRLLNQLAAVTGVAATAGFGPITDAHNAGIPNGPKVAVRDGYGTFADRLWRTTRNSAAAEGTIGEDVALASAAAARALGLRDGTGALVTDSGNGVVVLGELTVPDHLSFLDPLVVVPHARANPPSPLTVLVVLADSPGEVAVVAALVRNFLRDVTPPGASVETSEELAAIRAAVDGELGAHRRITVLVLLAVTALLVAVNLLALVTMRRKDFGRRRALGATQSLIIELLLIQVALLAAIGATIGVTATLTFLAATGDPTPASGFALAVAVSAVLAAVVAALPPAVIAARRDPLHELRVP